MPWPWKLGLFRKKSQTTSEGTSKEDRDRQGLDDEEWSSGSSSPFLRWLSSARLALCGPRSSCSCTTFTMATALSQVAVFLITLLVISADPNPSRSKSKPRDGIGDVSAFVGPSGCAMLSGGALWPSSLRHGQLHMLLSAGFVFASLFHMIVSVISLVRYGLPFEAKRGCWTFLGTFFAAGAVGALTAGALLPGSILAAGSSASLALMGDEFVTVIWTGGLKLFDGGSRKGRALPLRLLVLAGFFGAHLLVFLFFSAGFISLWACLASFCFGILVSMTAHPSRSSRNAKIDEGEGTGDVWAMWKRHGFLAAIVATILFMVTTILGFERAVIPNRAAPC